MKLNIKLKFILIFKLIFVTLISAAQTKLQDSNSKIIIHQVTLGIGLTYFYYNQSQSSISPLNFKSFRGPSTFLEYKYKWNSDFFLLFNFKQAPGYINSGETLKVKNHNFNWKTYSLDFKSKLSSNNKVFLGRKIEYGIASGFLYHQAPILSLTEMNTAEIEYTNISVLNLGGFLDYQLNNKINTEVFFRYGHVFATRNITLTQPLLFDGSLGLQYHFNSNLAYGWYWYGQYQTYKYSHNDSNSNTKNIGKQTLLYSNMDLRLILKF